jgi:hypothetical protein
LGTDKAMESLKRHAKVSTTRPNTMSMKIAMEGRDFFNMELSRLSTKGRGGGGGRRGNEPLEHNSYTNYLGIL